ncbi:MAG: TetR/AcrR family transcriptional regulator [Cytophagales bacterium]|nr:TetR/AcrR family transcriptional regulator [Cytophagales bacterium]
MQELLKSIQIRVNDKIYLKDPESSELGKNIVRRSIDMIHSMGLEAFTFKKLAIELSTTESTIYRYFENKHKLLIYLISWYWGWLEYEMVLNSINIADPVEKLGNTIETICHPLKNNIEHDHINLQPLHKIIIEESNKAFLTKEVDIENEDGLFSNYKRINDRLIKNIKEINPHYPYANTLASIIIDSSNHQRFLANHFPRLTDIDKTGSDLGSFLVEMVLKTIKTDR